MRTDKMGAIASIGLVQRSGATAVELGRTMTAAEVAAEICDGRVSPKWVIEKWGHKIGHKPGRAWFFYESEARAAWRQWLESGRGGSVK